MKIVTSLSFRGECRQAFEFYAKVLGGKITAAYPYGDAPPDMPVSDPKYKDWLMHCWLEVGDQARRWFDALKEGGNVVMEFSETFWSPGYGAVVDRFGVPWMVNTIPAAGE